MFDDQQQNQVGEQPIPKQEPEPTVMPDLNEAPSNIPVPNEPEDIFKDSEATSVPSTPPEPQAAPEPSGPPEPLKELPDDLDGDEKDKKFFIMGLVIVFIIVFIGGYYAYTKLFKDDVMDVPLVDFTQEDSINDSNDIIIDEESDNVPTSEELEQEISDLEDQITPSEDTTDSDNDGLTDVEELAIGTDPFEVDSDGDGLFDREEVKVYHTNPLNPDTDGDGWLDGTDEVHKGWDPLGPGRLLDINNQ
ncbi:hypothetical protein HN800_02020 [bacterium]|jgi:hypothetical protein|nr:hypothetical protein [bacterium]MBT4495234.1 hypothetical protein [bacterium]MBT4763843.1 hypothetical protein [bacterium]MBT5401213.1 hypothetical protein [bacterium]MBT5942827.1 hypothetical protein [bacterium]